MADVVSPAVRSRMMSGIRGKDTQPELILRKGLYGRGVRIRLHAASLPGRPDFVTRKHNAVVFVHGCFWHAHHGCVNFRIPEGNRQFWVDKLHKNEERDNRAVEKLLAAGWRVAVVWECATRVNPEAAIDALYSFMTSGKRFVEIAKDKRCSHLSVRFRRSTVIEKWH